MTFREQLHTIPSQWLWIGAFVIVAIFGYGLTPWEVIASLLESRGLGGDQQQQLAFAAGYTLPLTVGFAVITYLGLTGEFSQHSIYEQIGGAAIILAVCGWIAGELGLGLLPNYSGAYGTGPWYVRIPMLVLSAYFNSYGFGLMLSSLALGIAAAIEIDRWTSGSSARA